MLGLLPHAHVLAYVKPAHLRLRHSLIYCQRCCRFEGGGVLRVCALSEEAYTRRNPTLMRRRITEHPCCGLGRVETVIDLIILDRHVLTRYSHVLDHLLEFASCAFDNLPHSPALLRRGTATVLRGLRS